MCNVDRSKAVLDTPEMEFVSLPNGFEDRFDTSGVELWVLADLQSAEVARTHVARYVPHSVLGRHPTKLWQLFMVVDGSGWVSGADDERCPIKAGQAVMWKPGESHASGSDDGMLAVMVASTTELTLLRWQ